MLRRNLFLALLASPVAAVAGMFGSRAVASPIMISCRGEAEPVSISDTCDFQADHLDSLDEDDEAPCKLNIALRCIAVLARRVQELEAP